MKLLVNLCSGGLAVVAASSAAAAGDPLAPIGLGPRPAPPPIQPVTETFYGQSVTDNYRYMEALDPKTVAWIKAQGAYTRRVLEAIRPLAAVQARVSAFTGSFGFVQDLPLTAAEASTRSARRARTTST